MHQETKPAIDHPQAGACVHHWVLGEPQRGTVQGHCRRCGADRSFPAAVDVPPPAPEGEEEPVLDIPALTAAVSSLQKHALI
jgi:hypothetical protein